MRNAENQRVCRDIGAIQGVLHMIEKHEDDKRVYMRGCLALGAMVGNDAESTRLFLSLGGMEHLVRATQIRNVYDNDGTHKSLQKSLDIIRRAQGTQNDGAYGAGEQRLRLSRQDVDSSPAQSKTNSEPDNASHKQIEACVACSKTPAELGMARLLKCSACTLAPAYCSGECQRVHWRAHKSDCKAHRKAKC
jgi:hypothetical protein